jgi:16S rRNA processing protein RimM
VPAGRVGRPHGLDGSFHVTRPGTFALGGEVLVNGEPHTLDRLAGTPGKPILRLAGASSRADAEALRGAELRVRRDAVPLEPGEFWATDVVGCLVVDGAREIGVVTGMIVLPSCEALEVGDLLVPLVRDAIRSIDLEARRIDVDMGFVGA